MENVETTKQIYALIPKIMKQVGAIGKDKRNEIQRYNFRGIDDVYNALSGPMADNGVFVVPSMIGDAHRTEWATKNGGRMFGVALKMSFKFYAPDGSFVEAIMPGEGMDTGDKATNKAMSAALKYAMIEVFCIPTEEPKDSENDSPEVVAKVEPKMKPVAPAVNPKAYDRAMVQVQEIMESRGFPSIASMAPALDYAEKIAKKPLKQFTDKNWANLITAIADGKFDQFINTAGTPA